MTSLCRLRLPAFMAVAGLVTAAFIGEAIAQTQQAPPPQQQFGPRVQQPQAGTGPRVAQPPQQQRQGPPPAVVLGKFGDWTLQCETEKQPQGQSMSEASGDGASGKSDPAAAKKNGAEQNCGLVQNTRDPKRENIQLTLVIASGMQNNKRVTMMRVIAPIGVFLPTGVALEIDGEAVGRVPFTRCLPQVCVAFAEASAPTLEKLRKGAKANFIIYEAPGLGITMPISLAGITKGLEELEKL